MNKKKMTMKLYLQLSDDLFEPILYLLNSSSVVNNYNIKILYYKLYNLIQYYSEDGNGG